MKKVLLIAFHFPPVKGSSGLHRTLSLAKYLPDFGWRPAVLSAAPRAYDNVSDELLKEIPNALIVKRAFALDATRHLAVRGRYLQLSALPDRWSSWWLGAVVKGWQHIKRIKPQLIWTTYPIATTHLIGLTLHKLTGVPWIADFRDSMTEEHYPINPRVRSVYRWIEKKTVQHAEKIVFTTSGAVNMYALRYPEIPHDRWAVIENAVDEDFVCQIEEQLSRKVLLKKQKLKFVHSGILYPSERDPTHFFNALSYLKKNKVISSAEVEFILRASTNEDVYRRQTKQLDIADLVFFEPAISYPAAIEEMFIADGLLIFQSRNCNHQIPAKIYEYFRSGRPILGLTDAEGNTAELLSQESGTMLAALDDKDEIVNRLSEFIQVCRVNRDHPVRSVAGRYSRHMRVEQYAGILDEISGDISCEIC